MQYIMEDMKEGDVALHTQHLHKNPLQGSIIQEQRADRYNLRTGSEGPEHERNKGSDESQTCAPLCTMDLWLPSFIESLKLDT